MEQRRLGRTGHVSSVLLYGAAALADVDQGTADRSLEDALAAGINHIDVAADYGDAEVRVGATLPAYRDRVFVATKTGVRHRDGAWAEVNRSLERLRTDRVDLLQLHAVGDVDDLDLATGTGGALEAAVRARDEGLTSAIGITGHGPLAAQTHLEALRRFPFDTVLTPLNPVLWRDEPFRVAYSALVDEARRRDVGLMTIKTLARRTWPHEQGPYATWYEPFDRREQVRAALSWVLAHEEVTGIATVGDVRLLPMLVDAERDRMDASEAERVLAADPDYASPFLSMPF